jgi:hypothetical protein
MRNLLYLAGFQTCWFACILGAAYSRPWAGPAVTAALLTVHLLTLRQWRAELALAALAAAAGFAADSLLVLGGLLSFPPGARLGAPSTLWMTALWAAFAALLNGPLAWLQGRQFVAAAFGALGGPLAYAAGERLGAVELPQWPSAMAGVAAVWALATPSLLAISVWTRKRFAAAQEAAL